MISIALLVCLLGLILWFIFSRPKFAEAFLAEVGRLSFFAGLLAFLLSVGSRAVL